MYYKNSSRQIFFLFFSEILFGNKGDQGFGRRSILLQFTPEQRKEFFKERIADPYPYTTSFSRESSKINIHDCLSLFTTCEKLSADDAW